MSDSTYRGTTPRPADFDAFWDARMAEADAVPLCYAVEPSEIPAYPTCEYLNLWFTGMGGARIYAKYLRPKSDKPLPLVLQFHGYPGASRSWLEQSSFAGMGYALLAMDCPGQGGKSQDIGGFLGTTVSGHLIAGLDGEPKDMYYVRLYQNIRILCRIVRQMKDIDQRRIYINGASQGAGLGIACAALNPDLPCKAAILYPFLSDFQKVFELGADEIAYEGLRYYARWFDPDGSRANEWFTKLGYVDAVHLASRIRCEVLFGTGLADVVCPPITQDAVYNNLTCKKRRVFFPGFGHEEIQAFDDMLLTFFDDAPVVPCPVSTPTAEYQTVTFAADDGATLSARYIRPVGNKRVPTVLMFHDAGRPVRGWHHMTRFVALGYAVFALENRAEADAQTQFADAQAAARAALSLPTTLNLNAWGEGLGGTLAIAAAAKQPQHVIKCAAQNPLCTGAYADCAQYAAQLVCPLLMGTSGMDTIAPPDAQNAVYDAASCNKKRYIYVKYTHERINAFEDRVLAFFHPMV